MSAKHGSKRSHESTQAQSGQLDIRSCFNGITKDELEYSNADSAPTKKRVISHVGGIIAAACHDHRVKDVPTRKRMHDDWCQMVTRCARRPQVHSGHDVASHETVRRL